MNDIQKYRKASAEWLGVKEQYTNGMWFCQYPDNIESTLGRWLPDIDANQQNMIKAELIKNHFDVRLQFEQDNGLWLAEICKVLSDGFMEIYCSHEDILDFTAFRKAWMQFYETLEK